jgi:endonuclease/exonuclease/phosphatase family metal-dependent hydrolase
MAATLCTFNANNLFLRYKFGNKFPGDISGKSMVDDVGWGYLPEYKPHLFEVFSPEQRTLAARAVKRGGATLPDILCVQEVESLMALRDFNERYFGREYPYALLIDGRDLRQIDVGILSRFPFDGVRTYVDVPVPGGKPDDWLFSRDCLEVHVPLNKSGSRKLGLFINHFKSKLTDAKTPSGIAAQIERANEKRLRQAKKVAEIIKKRYPGAAYRKGLFAVVGDFNDHPGAAPLAPLVAKCDLEDPLGRLPAEERWTHYYRRAGSVAQFDYMLLSPALSKATQGAEFAVERRGVGFRDVSTVDEGPLPKQAKLERMDDDPAPLKIDFRFKRFPGVTADLSASDHCPLFLEIPV